MAIDKITGVSWDSIANVSGVAKANIANVNGQDAPSDAGIVTNNLYQYYDASDSNSYPGTGTTWTDLQGNYNVTLIGGPTYNVSAPAHFDFDNVNDRARGASNYAASSSDFTVESWVRADGLINSKRYSVVASYESTATNRRFLFNFERNKKFRFLVADTSGNTTGALVTSDTFSTGTWYHVCATKSGTTATIYIDGSFSTSMTLSSSSVGTCNLFGIAERQLSSLDLLDGDVSKVRIYADALDASEVLQNYNAEKTYYGHS